jgi:hypothetical protein
MPNTPDGIARAIEARSPFDIDGTSFTLALSGFNESLPHEVKHIEVRVMTLSTDAAQRYAPPRPGQLHRR